MSDENNASNIQELEYDFTGNGTVGCYWLLREYRMKKLLWLLGLLIIPVVVACGSDKETEEPIRCSVDSVPNDANCPDNYTCNGFQCVLKYSTPENGQCASEVECQEGLYCPALIFVCKPKE